MSGHAGRCFRAWRKTRARKARAGLRWDRPIRQKVPLALRPFLVGAVGSIQKHAGADAMASAIYRYAQHQSLIGAPRRGGARGQ